MSIGKKIKFDGEKQRYTIQALDSRYIIATKPFNARKTYIYTIVDLQEKRRGPCDLIFGSGEAFNTAAGAKKNLTLLTTGKMGVSYRRDKKLTADELKTITTLLHGTTTK